MAIFEVDFPVALRMSGRMSLVVGGGEVAERRTKALLAAGASVRVVSPSLTEGLLRARDRFEYRARHVEIHDFEGVRFVFAATDDRAVNRSVAEDARRLGVLVNTADDPEACDFTMPAVTRTGPICVGVSTGGESPSLAARIRSRIATTVLRPELGAAAHLLGRARRAWKANAGSEQGDSVFSRVLEAGLVDAIFARDSAAVDRALSVGLGPGVTASSLGFDLTEAFPPVEEGVR